MTATLTNADASAAPATHHPVRTREQAIGRALAVVLGLLTIFGPISMDLYLPVLPALTTELQSATSTAQLTITACLLGLALGQLIAGPLSDRFGRRRPLLIGVIAYIATSALCALSPTIETLIVARFVQGLAGAVGIVIAQAAGRDLYSGRKLVRYYGRLTVLGGLAAIVGPVIGGQIATITDWRGLFLFLAAVGAAILVASMFVFRETLAREHRVTGELTHMAHDFRRLLADRVFLGAMLVTGFTNAALFAYLSGATYVLQGIHRLSPQEYSFAFGLNSLGFMAFGYLAGRLSEWWSEKGTLVVGLVMCVLGAGGLLATAAPHLPLIAVIVSLLMMVSGVAVTSPPATSLALAKYPDVAGTASALLGLARFAFGGLAAPLVGLGGAGDAVPLGLVTVVSAALAVTAYATTIKPLCPDQHPTRARSGARAERWPSGRLALPGRWGRYSAVLLCAALATGLTACTATSNDSPAPRATSTSATTPAPAAGSPADTGAPSMRIHLTIGDTVLPATLDDTPASRDFAALLPLTVTLSDYAGTEKISDLPRKLSTAGAPAGTDAAVGDITYYAPWGNLAIFYQGSGYASGLVKLGSIASGVEALANQQGSFSATIDRAD